MIFQQTSPTLLPFDTLHQAVHTNTLQSAGCVQKFLAATHVWNFSYIYWLELKTEATWLFFSFLVEKVQLLEGEASLGNDSTNPVLVWDESPSAYWLQREPEWLTNLGT